MGEISEMSNSLFRCVCVCEFVCSFSTYPKEKGETVLTRDIITSRGKDDGGVAMEPRPVMIGWLCILRKEQTPTLFYHSTRTTYRIQNSYKQKRRCPVTPRACEEGRV